MAQHLQTVKTYCVTAGEGMQRDRETKKREKENTVNLCQVCFLYCQIVEI